MHASDLRPSLFRSSLAELRMQAGQWRPLCMPQSMQLCNHGVAMTWSPYTSSCGHWVHTACRSCSGQQGIAASDQAVIRCQHRVHGHEMHASLATNSSQLQVAHELEALCMQAPSALLMLPMPAVHRQ